MKNYFQDQVVIITGASGGIGESTARAISKRGAITVLAARRMDKLERLSKELDRSLPIKTDVSEEKSVKNLIDHTLQTYGRIDILINNAGILLYKMLEEASFDEVRRVMDINYFGAVYGSMFVLPIMKKQKSGVIVNVSSIAGKVGLPNIGFYCASKFALTGFSETLRQEVSHLGIRVCTVSPGTVYTPMTKEYVDRGLAKGKKNMPVTPDFVADKIISAIEKKKAHVIIPLHTRLLYYCYLLFPGLIERLAWRYRSGDGPELPGRSGSAGGY